MAKLPAKPRYCVDCNISLEGRSGRVLRCLPCAAERQKLMVQASQAKRAAAAANA